MSLGDVVPRKEGRSVELQPTLRRTIVRLGTPLALTGCMLFHPSPYDDYLGEQVPIANWWITLHTVQFVLFALMGAAIWMLTDGLRGIVATLSRVAAAVFAVFYDAGDAIAGISTGILASGHRDAISRSRKEPPVQHRRIRLDRGAGGAAVALYRAGAPRTPLVLLVLPAIFLSFFDHAFPFGSLAFGSFFVVAAWLELAQGRITVARQPRRVS
jgi:hypothetical protein